MKMQNIDHEINVVSLNVACDRRGHMLVIKLLTADGKTQCVMMPSSIALWYGRNRQKLRHGPYDVPEPQPEIEAQDWDGSRALVMTDMEALQTGDALSFLATSSSKKVFRVTLPPACHALFGHYIGEYWNMLVDPHATGDQRPQ